MNGKRNPAPGGNREAGQTETAAFGGAATSCNYSTTGGADRQPRFIESLLLHGEENAKTLKDLIHITQWPERAIRKEIEVERRHVPILSGQRGYWVAGSVDEVNTFCRSMRHRARQIWQSAANVERAAGLTGHEPLEGQTDFWCGGDG